MNVLGLVFSILLILSFSLSISFDRQVVSQKIRSQLRSHLAANRKILNSYQSKVYQNAAGAPQEKKKEKRQTEKEAAPKIPVTKFNGACARINLFCLLEKKNKFLEELIASLFKTFYAPLLAEEKGAEYKLLDSILKGLKKMEHPSLENLFLEDPTSRQIFYRMQKGTKKWDLKEKKGFPPLSDYILLESKESKICIQHADLNLLTLLLGEKAATIFYNKIHGKEKPLVSLNLLEESFKEAHQIAPHKELIPYLEFEKVEHEKTKKPFLGEDPKSGLSIRKDFYITQK